VEIIFSNFFVPGFCNAVDRLLRRTLVRSEIYQANKMSETWKCKTSLSNYSLVSSAKWRIGNSI